MGYRATREIIHVTVDDFYASVLRKGEPSLRSRPVVVGYLASRGAVVGASVEALEAGVRPGMNMAQARRLCSDAAFLEVDWALFRRVSKAIIALVRRYAPVVEVVGLGGSFIDYTGCSRLYGRGVDTAWRLQREIGEEVSLSASMGLAGNKLVSEVAARLARRGGIVEVPKGEEGRFLSPLPVEWLPGVGRARSEKLAALGVRTLGTLAEVPAELMARVFGPVGRLLVERAKGVDNRPVAAKDVVVSLEEVFPEDVVDYEAVDSRLYSLCERVGTWLRERSLGARSLALELIYTDGYRVRHGGYLERTTALDGEIYRCAAILLKRALGRRVKVRALRLEVTKAEGLVEQADMFHSKRSKLAALYEACDKVRKKHGDGVLRMGKTVTGELPIGLPSAVHRRSSSSQA